MKKLAIKKVALSLFLAGYAASSAYALEPAITQNSIEGSKPVIWSKGITTGGTAVERSLTVRISNDTTGATSLGNNEKAKVGNYIHIFYDLVDADGDEDSADDDKRAVLNTLTVFAKIGTSSTWTEISDITKDFAVNGQEGHIFFKISPSMAGATKIGFKLEEITPYGAPRENEWLWVSNIWDGTTTPGHGSNPTDPGSDPHGPGDKDPDIPEGPIEYPGATMLGIFKYTSTGSVDFTDNLAASSSTTPKYGDKLAAVVWLKANSSSTSTTPNFTSSPGGDTNQSASYTFTWSLEGTNSAAGGSQTAAANTLVGVAAGDPDASSEGYGVIKLGDSAGGKHNTVYNGLNGGSDYVAGIQGFKLKVTAN